MSKYLPAVVESVRHTKCMSEDSMQPYNLDTMYSKHTGQASAAIWLQFTQLLPGQSLGEIDTLQHTSGNNELQCVGISINNNCCTTVSVDAHGHTQGACCNALIQTSPALLSILSQYTVTSTSIKGPFPQKQFNASRNKAACGTAGRGPGGWSQWRAFRGRLRFMVMVSVAHSVFTCSVCRACWDLKLLRSMLSAA